MMLFKKGEVVMYPKFGISKISRIYSEDFNGEPQKYYELFFETGNLTVSIPIEKATDLGVRYPTSKKEFQKKLLLLTQPYRVYEKTLTNIISISNEHIASGKIEDAIELIRILRGVSKLKKAKNKPIGLTDKDNLRFCLDFVKGEVELILGKSAVKKYGLED